MKALAKALAVCACVGSVLSLLPLMLTLTAPSTPTPAAGRALASTITAPSTPTPAAGRGGAGPGFTGLSLVVAGLCRNAVKHDRGERLPHVLDQLALLGCDPVLGELHLVILESNSGDNTAAVLKAKVEGLLAARDRELAEATPRARRRVCIASVALPPDTSAVLPEASAEVARTVGRPGVNGSATAADRISRITAVRASLHAYLTEHFAPRRGAPASVGGRNGLGARRGRTEVDWVALLDYDVFGFDPAGLLATLRKHGASSDSRRPRVLCAYSLDANNWYRDTYATVHTDGSWSHPTVHRKHRPGTALGVGPPARSQPPPAGELLVRSCFGGLALYPPKEFLGGGCSYHPLGALDALGIQANAPFPPSSYVDTEDRTCEHIGLHFCLAARHGVAVYITDWLRVWYRRMDARANTPALPGRVL